MHNADGAALAAECGGIKCKGDDFLRKKCFTSLLCPHVSDVTLHTARRFRSDGAHGAA